MMSEEPNRPDLEQLFAVIRRKATQLTRNQDDAEDLIQDALVKILTKQSVLEGLMNARYPKAFVARLVTNLWYDMVRQRRAQQSHEVVSDDTLFDEFPSRASCPSPFAVASCEIDDVHREAFWLKVVEKCSYAEIAKRLGITKTQAVSKVARAQAILRDYLLASELTKAQRKEALRVVFRIEADD